ncbi:MAG: oligosaccharide repeat unit polymerase, partial [SAR324 cluster bacterium]|nr:oligosaccharide repeat unit polymerase [SAR324 cluster bacterium]
FFILDRLKNRKLLQLNWIVFAAVILLAIVVSYTAVGRIKRSGSDELSSLVYGRTFDALENSIRITETYEPGEHLGLNIIVYPATNFVPRSLWPGKPIGLGKRIMFDIYGAPANTPVSFVPGLIGEFYVDFGYFGILIFGLLFGFIIKKIDYGILHSLKGGRVGSCFFLITIAVLSSVIPNSPQGYLLRLIITGIFQIVFTLILAWIIRSPRLIGKRRDFRSKLDEEKKILLKER